MIISIMKFPLRRVFVPNLPVKVCCWGRPIATWMHQVGGGRENRFLLKSVFFVWSTIYTPLYTRTSCVIGCDSPRHRFSVRFRREKHQNMSWPDLRMQEEWPGEVWMVVKTWKIILEYRSASRLGEGIVLTAPSKKRLQGLYNEDGQWSRSFAGDTSWFAAFWLYTICLEKCL